MTVFDRGATGLLAAVAVSTGAQLLARVGHLALSMVASLALIRYLGAAGYGDYVFVISFVGVFTLLSDFGLSTIAVREMAKDEAGAPAILGTAILARLALAVGCWFLAQGVLLAMGMRADLLLAVAVASLSLGTEALRAIVAVFQVRIAMQYEAVVSMVAQGIETLAVLVLVSSGAGLLQVVAVPVLGSIVGCILAFVLAFRKFGASLRFDLRRLPILLVSAVPIGLALLLTLASFRLDGVLLGAMATPVDVGLYGAAFKPIEYLALGLVALMNPVFPLLARWHRTDPARFRHLYQRGIEALLAITLPVAVVLVILAEPIVTVLYSPEYGPSAPALQVLAVSLVIGAVSAWQGYTLVAGGEQRIPLAYNGLAFIVNIAMNLALIGPLGYMGPVWAQIATNVVAVGCSFMATTRLLDVRPDSSRFAALALANVMLAACLWLSLRAGAPAVLATALAALTYPAWLLLFRVTTLTDVRRVLPRGGSFATPAPGLEIP